MSFVTLDQFRLRYENTIPAADEPRVQALLEDACALAADTIGTTYAPGEEVPGGVVAIVCTAVRRAYENPLGLVGETIGEYSWRAASSSSGLYFTAEEVRALRRAAGRGGVGSIELQGLLPAPASDDSQYIGVLGSGEPVLYFHRDDL